MLFAVFIGCTGVGSGTRPRVVQVPTGAGDVAAEVLVDDAGLWVRQVAHLATALDSDA
jgi:hypothetical protein